MNRSRFDQKKWVLQFGAVSRDCKNIKNPQVTKVRDHANRVLIVIASLGGGGAERVVVDFCEYLLEQGREVTVLTTNGDDCDAYTLPGGVARKRIEIRRPAKWWFDSVRFALGSLWKLRKQIQAIKPDVIVSFIDQTNVRVLLAMTGTGLPTVVCERSHPGHQSLSNHWQIARRVTYRMADVVMVQTHEAAAWVRANIVTRQLRIVPNAVRRNLNTPSNRTVADADEKSVLAIGRFTPEKGFDLLVSAFEKSGLAETGWKLTILGDGPERPALEQQVRSLGLTGSVLMPGHQDSVFDWLANAQMFVLASRHEGFPNALLEAMQLGVPSISFDCPSGPADIIANEHNGLLVPREDIAALAAALRRLASDADLRNTLSAEAVRVNERYSPGTVYSQWTGVIDDVFRHNNIPAKH